MDEFMVEFFVGDEKDEEVKISDLSDIRLEDWKVGLEKRALGEYYNKKIKISVKKS